MVFMPGAIVPVCLVKKHHIDGRPRLQRKSQLFGRPLQGGCMKQGNCRFEKLD
jgi:hypothetical protein